MGVGSIQAEHPARQAHDVVDISASLLHPEGMRTTITIDDDVYQAASHLSRVSGKRLGKVLSELARHGLKPPELARPKQTGRFPVFDVPDGAPVIPASRVQEVVDEEGLF